MKNNAQRIAVGRSDTSDWEQREGSFSLWDALEFAFEEKHSPNILESLIHSFSCLDVETQQAAALLLYGEKGGRSPDDLKKRLVPYILKEHLEDSRVGAHITAAEAVGTLIRQALTEALALQLVSDESTPVRVASAEALGELSGSMMLHAFKESLSDPSWEVRTAAIQALGKLSEQLIVEPLRTALDDQDFSVRSAALHAFGTLKGCVPTEDLVSLAQEETNDWITRDAAVTALERAGECTLAKSLRASLDYTLETESDLTEEELLAFESVGAQAALPEQSQDCVPSIQTFAQALEIVTKRPPLGTCFLVYRGHDHAHTKGTWSPDGTNFALGGSSGVVQTQDAHNDVPLWAYNEYVGWVNTLAWSPDGTRIASGSSDQTVQIWDASNGRHLHTYRGHISTVNALAWSPDGSRIASAAGNLFASDQTIQVWDANSGQLLQTYRGHTGWVNALAWSPDGLHIASAAGNLFTSDQTIQVWDANSGQLLHTCGGHTDWVNALAWSPDGTRLPLALLIRPCGSGMLAIAAYFIPMLVMLT